MRSFERKALRARKENHEKRASLGLDAESLRLVEFTTSSCQSWCESLNPDKAKRKKINEEDSALEAAYEQVAGRGEVGGILDH